MLAPLLHWRARGATTDGMPAEIKLGRGQIVGISGDEWKSACAELLENPAVSAAVQQPAGRSSGDPSHWGARTHAVIILTSQPEREAYESLMNRLDDHAASGGGALVIGNALPDHPAYTRICRLGGEPMRDLDGRLNLLDDHGVPVRHLRSGEWGGISVDLPEPELGLYEGIRFGLTDEAGRAIVSDATALSTWRGLAPRPSSALLRFAPPVPAGSYSARVELIGKSAVASVPAGVVRVRDTRDQFVPDRLQVAWRLLAAPSVTPAVAGLNLRLSPRRQLLLGSGETPYLTRGWHPCESGPDGTAQRWTRGRAEFVLSGSEAGQSLSVVDLRPRIEGQPVRTRLSVSVDGRVTDCHEWESPGGRRLGLTLPDDGLNHLVRIDVVPEWSPKEYGVNEDDRRMGILVRESRTAAPRA